jgi:protein involved in polysaccharide export with SLBB domain
MMVAVLSFGVFINAGCWSTLTRPNQTDRPTLVLTQNYANFKTAEEFMTEFKEQIIKERYRIQPGTNMSIKVTGAPEMTFDVLVSPDGYIDLPYIGERKVGDYTVPEIRGQMNEDLRKFFTDFDVVINFIDAPLLKNVTSYANVFSTYLNINRGGRVALRGDENLLDILADMSAIQPLSAWKTIYVYKKQKPDPDNNVKPLMVVECNVRKFLIEGDSSQNVPIRTGDMIYIPIEENDWLKEFYASLQIGNSIMGGMTGWRDNVFDILNLKMLTPHQQGWGYK